MSLNASARHHLHCTWAVFKIPAWQRHAYLCSWVGLSNGRPSLSPGMTTTAVVVPTVALLVAAIMALLLWMLKGRVQSHHGDTWWHIPYGSITALPQHKVRPHTSLVTCRGASPRNLREPGEGQLTHEVSSQRVSRPEFSF